MKCTKFVLIRKSNCTETVLCNQTSISIAGLRVEPVSLLLGGFAECLAALYEFCMKENFIYPSYDWRNFAFCHSGFNPYRADARMVLAMFGVTYYLEIRSAVYAYIHRNELV